MITNRRQYNVTRGQIRRLEAALEASQLARDRMDRRVFGAMVAGIESQISDLRGEIAEYAELEKAEAIEVDSAEELPVALIRARIALGLTQKELAAKLSVPPQQVQRYESTRYEGVGFRRMLDVIRAMGLVVTAHVDLRPKVQRRQRSVRARLPQRKGPQHHGTRGAKSSERR
jgi:HTH-type transcriptional regulator/antitoxin HigA